MRALAPLWRELPFWYLWLAPFGLLDLELNQLGGDAGAAVLAFLPTFLLISWLFGATRRRSGRAWAIYGGASAALLLLILAGWTGPRFEPPVLLRAFEISALAGFALLGLHALIEGGSRTAGLIFGTGLVYGLFLESAGVGMGFFAEDGYLLYLPFVPAPLCTGLGWCCVFYPLWWAVPRLPLRSVTGRALAATGIALAFDLHLDPVATAAGFWVWHPSLPPAIRGVPWVNFCAWAAAVLPFAWAAFRARSLPGSPARRVALQLPLILLAATALVLALIAIAEAGVNWPSMALFARAAAALLPA